MIRRVATADLMFGSLPAPPPSIGQTTETLGVSEVLECFTDDGLPTETTSLSPIAVVRVEAFVSSGRGRRIGGTLVVRIVWEQ